MSIVSLFLACLLLPFASQAAAPKFADVTESSGLVRAAMMATTTIKMTALIVGQQAAATEWFNRVNSATMATMMIWIHV